MLVNKFYQFVINPKILHNQGDFKVKYITKLIKFTNVLVSVCNSENRTSKIIIHWIMREVGIVGSNFEFENDFHNILNDLEIH